MHWLITHPSWPLVVIISAALMVMALQDRLNQTRSERRAVRRSLVEVPRDHSGRGR
jgi:hypothetical protein